MRHAALALAVVVLMAFAEPGWAQGADPYADAVKAEKLKQYLDFRKRYLEQMEYLEWAAGCKVMSDQAAISKMMNQIASESDPRIVDNKIEALRNEAAERGLAKAQEADGCAYWHDHPEEVLTLRQRAQNSLRW